jgi:metallo-beta-lactamase family protein
MKIQFLGAADTVTGSKYLLQHDGTSLLVDCGLFQGYKVLRDRNWAPLSFDPAALSRVVLTHAHLDHSGYLPLLVKRGFRRPILCTTATADLCRILLMDSAALQEEDAERANRRGYSRHTPALPLYTRRDAERALALMEPQSYGETFRAGPFSASFHQAGHILGASFVTLSAGGVSVLFSGDLGRPHDLIMKPPESPPDADYIVVESTYGNRLHGGEDMQRTLARAISRTVKRGGVVMFPSFAVGRAQDLLFRIHLLKANGDIPRDLPVYLNSPMATDVTNIYYHHRAEHRLSDAEARAMCDAAKVVNSAEDSKELNAAHGPMIIIAGSGMATGGRIVHHLRSFGPDPKNTIVFPGFQAGGTRGASIVGGARTVRIFGEDVEINAEVVSLDGLSAHADYQEILGWLSHIKHRPRQVFVTHGEPAASDALRARIKRELRWDARVPEHMEQCDLGQRRSG